MVAPHQLPSFPPTSFLAGRFDQRGPSPSPSTIQARKPVPADTPKPAKIASNCCTKSNLQNQFVVFFRTITSVYCVKFGTGARGFVCFSHDNSDVDVLIGSDFRLVYHLSQCFCFCHVPELSRQIPPLRVQCLRFEVRSLFWRNFTSHFILFCPPT